MFVCAMFIQGFEWSHQVVKYKTRLFWLPNYLFKIIRSIIVYSIITHWHFSQPNFPWWHILITYPSSNIFYIITLYGSNGVNIPLVHNQNEIVKLWLTLSKLLQYPYSLSLHCTCDSSLVMCCHRHYILYCSVLGSLGHCLRKNGTCYDLFGFLYERFSI